MTDPIFYLSMAGASVAVVGIVAMTTLTGWRGWLELKRSEMQQMRLDSAPPSAASRIEVADLKERIRKLEAIAAGVEL